MSIGSGRGSNTGPLPYTGIYITLRKNHTTRPPDQLFDCERNALISKYYMENRPASKVAGGIYISPIHNPL